MVKTLAFFGALALFLACASAPPGGVEETAPSLAEQWKTGRVLAGSRCGGLTLIGVSSRLSGPEEEIEAARLHAARQAAMFHGVRVSARFVNRTGGGVLDFIAESETEVGPLEADYQRFAGRLAFDPGIDVLRFYGEGIFGRGGTLVRFTYAAPAAHVGGAGGTDADGRPGWTALRGLPEVEGHAVAVGFSPNRVWLRDAVTGAINDAAARLAMGMGSSVSTITVDVRGQAFTYITSEGGGVLSGFRILEFWIDPADMSVYALGIAGRPE